MLKSCGKEQQKGLNPIGSMEMVWRHLVPGDMCRMLKTCSNYKG